MTEWLDDESCSTGGHRFIMKHETSQNSFPWSVCDSRRGNGLWLVLQMCSDWHVKAKTATLCLLRKGELDYSGVCRKYWWKLIIQQMSMQQTKSWGAFKEPHISSQVSVFLPSWVKTLVLCVWCQLLTVLWNPDSKQRGRDSEWQTHS